MVNTEFKEFVSEHRYPHFFSNEPWNALNIIAAGVLGISMFDYQCEILQTVMYYNQVAVVASRQIGKSVCIAILALCWALSKPNQTILIVSTGERQVKELLTKRNYSIKKIFKRQSRESGTIMVPSYETINGNANPLSLVQTVAGMSDIKLIPKYDQPGLKLEFGIESENAEELELSNGSRIVVIPCNPDTAAGFTIDLLIGDEVAKMPGWNDLQSAIFPMISRSNGKVALFSSYKGKNHWWRITEDKISDENPDGFKVLKYPIGVNPPPNLERLKHMLPEDVYAEEFECIPIDEAHSLFPYNLIDSCSKGTFEEWPDFLLSI